MKLKEIIKWEQLSKRSFAEIDLTNENDLLRLLYVSQERKISFEAFKTVASNSLKTFEKKIAAIFEDLKYQEQFFETTENEAGDGLEKHTYSEIAGFLIANGVNAEYVMNELELSEIYVLMKGIDTSRKERMEQKRFWTFYQILPQIDSKKIRSPKDLILFPWEEEEREKFNDEQFEEDSRKFDELIKKYNNGKA